MNLLMAHLKKLPESAGVYIFKEKNGRPIYVGKAKNLKKRVKTYFFGKPSGTKIKNLRESTRYIKTIRVDTEFEALLLEAELIKLHKPKFNVILKDDKHYIYIKITDEEFPKVLYARRMDDKKADFFGPYPSSGTVKNVVFLLRRIFPFCNQKRNAKKACFYSHIGLCSPCPYNILQSKGEVFELKKKIYRHNISLLKLVLKGKIPLVKHNLTKEMKKYSNQEEYEKAAQVKNQLEKLEYITQNYHAPESYIQDFSKIEEIRTNELNNLKEILNTYYTQLNLPKRIECYDISNITGKFATGSLVTFLNGDPAKNFYKRFRVRTLETPNDFAMLKEVFERRLSHNDWALPDLVIVDGGAPQVSTMDRILKEKKINIPLIGLAKKEEKIIIRKIDKFISLSLPRGTPALSLIQRLRDEAHRFAHKYHEHLRLKYLLGNN